MKTIITETDFVDSFHKAGRGNNFSREGFRALFEYLEGLEAETGEEMDADVIAICCEYTEYTYDEFAREEGLDDLLEGYERHDSVSEEREEIESELQEESNLKEPDEDRIEELEERLEELDGLETYDEDEFKEEIQEYVDERASLIIVDDESFICSNF